jgi:hypothetical protein
MRRVGDFLLFCAGVSPRLMATCPESERAKHTTIGVLVLITAGTAAIAMDYAAERVFDGAAIPLLLGLGYGSFAFCVDRFMILTIRKRRIAALVGQGFVRMAVATLVAIVVATPLEIRIVRDRVTLGREELRQRAVEQAHRFHARETGLDDTMTELAAENTTLSGLTRRLGDDPPGEMFKQAIRAADRCRADLTRVVERRRLDEPPLLRRLDEIDNETTDLEARDPASLGLTRLAVDRRDLTRRIDALRTAVGSKTQECNQLNASTLRQRQEYARALEEQLGLATAAVARLRNRQEVAEAATGKEMETARAVSGRAFRPGLVADLEGLWMMMLENTTIWWICMGLSLFLISLDVAPIVSKVIAPRGPYDAALEAEEAAAMAPHEATIAFHAQADQAVFAEALKLEHQCRGIEKALVAYMEVAGSFARRMQDLTTEFQTTLQHFERVARKSIDPADAHHIAKLIKDMNEMFGKARAEALAEFSIRIRQAFN